MTKRLTTASTPALALFLLPLTTPAHAQQTTSISFNCLGVGGNATPGTSTFTGTGTCSVTPYGTMTLVLTYTLVSATCPTPPRE